MGIHLAVGMAVGLDRSPVCLLHAANNWATPRESITTSHGCY